MIYRLYLPQEWAATGNVGAKAGVPEDIGFQTKPEIALEQIEAACAAGLPRGVVLMDAGYGCNTDLRADVSALGLTYVAGILPNTTVWTAGTAPLPPKKWSGQGRPPKLLRRDAQASSRSRSRNLRSGLPKRALAHDQVARRHGRAAVARALLACAFASRIATYKLTESRPEEWLLIEWPKGEDEPTKYWLSTLPRRHHLRHAGRSHQAALAHRARLSGTQAGGRARAFRRARLARLPPSRHAVHRSLRIPDLREGDDSPLRISFHQAVQDILPFPTVTDPEAPPLRPERHIPNSIATMRRRLIVALVRNLPRCPCCAAQSSRQDAELCDAVRMSSRRKMRGTLINRFDG